MEEGRNEDPLPNQTHPAPRTFPTERRVTRRDIDRSLSKEELYEWAEKESLNIGTLVPNEIEKIKVLRLLWTYRDLGAKDLRDIPPTDLVQHRIRLKEGCQVYSSIQRRFANDKEWWLRTIVKEGIDAGMYERTITANGRLSQWNAAPVLVPKKDQEQPRLTFNYHYVFEDQPGSYMELANKVHEFLSVPSHGVFIHFDIKHGYWAVEVHPDDRHFLAFTIPGLGQLQPTRMPQGTRTSSFTMTEMMNIALGPIPEPFPEPSLLHSVDKDTLPPVAFYVDDGFVAHRTYEEQYAFLETHLLPRLLWANLRISFKKLFLFVARVQALGEDHEIGGRVSLKPSRIEKIIDWPVPQTQTEVRSFLGTVQTTRRWVKGFAEIARPLQRLCGKVEWRWEEAEELSFNLLRHVCASKAAMFGWDPKLPVNLYSDASGFAAGCFISQVQDGEERPLYYDSFVFLPAERNYDTYKRELRAIVGFCTKFRHFLEGPITSTIHTDQKPLVGFLNSDTHEDIYARWATKLRMLNIKMQYIEGRRNSAADGLSRTIFHDKDCKTDGLVKKLAEEVRANDHEHEWFWKTGKGGYGEMLKKLSAEQRQGVIDSMRAEVDLLENLRPVGWTSFSMEGKGKSGQDLMLTPPYKDWYGDIYAYYRYQIVPKGLDKVKLAAFKAKVELYRWDDRTERILRKVGTYWVTCISQLEVAPLLERTHDRAGHFSSKIILDKIKYRVYWPKMANDIRDYIQGCLQCARYANSARSQPLAPIKTMEPFQLLGMDFIGPLPTSRAGHKFILHIIDYFSRYSFATATKDSSKEVTFQILEKLFDEFSTPIAIYSDIGTHFNNSLIHNFLDSRGVVWIHSPSASHKSTGMVEKGNDILQQVIKKSAAAEIETTIRDYTATTNNWDERLGHAVAAINSRLIERIGFSPKEIIFGTRPSMLLDLEAKYPTVKRSSVLDWIKDSAFNLPKDEEMAWTIWSFVTRREAIREDAQAKDSESKDRMKVRYDRSVRKNSFYPGEAVMLYDTTLEGVGGKLLPRWRGPFVVTGYGGEHNISYTIRQPSGAKIRGVYHGDHLRKFRLREGYLIPSTEAQFPEYQNLRRARRTTRTKEPVGQQEGGEGPKKKARKVKH